MPPRSLTIGYENPECPVGLEAVQEPLASPVLEDEMAEVLEWVELALDC
jgi:hypothetical protein